MIDLTAAFCHTEQAIFEILPGAPDVEIRDLRHVDDVIKRAEQALDPVMPVKRVPRTSR